MVLVFHEAADPTTGVKQLRLFTDTSRAGAYILKIGAGKEAKAVRLPKDAPLSRAAAAVGRELPGGLVAILSSESNADATPSSSVRLA